MCSSGQGHLVLFRVVKCREYRSAFVDVGFLSGMPDSRDMEKLFSSGIHKCPYLAIESGYN